MTTKEFYKKNKEKVLAQNKKYYLKNRDKIEKQKIKYYRTHKRIALQRMKNYYNSHKKEFSIKSKMWRENNQKILRKIKKKYWYKNRKKLNEQHKKYMRERYRKDNKFNILLKLRGRFGVAWRYFLKTHNLPSNSKKYSIDYEKAIIHLFKTKPKNIRGWDIEHKIPLCKFDMLRKEDVKKAFAPKNLQWMKHKDNLKKGKSIQNEA